LCAETRGVLTDDVVMMPAIVRAELDRYTFRIPVQVTAYFYGYWKLMALQGRTRLALSAVFNCRSFHDFVLTQGLLPPPLLAGSVRSRPMRWTG
jgi:uncharacterized protein (DUF885 family)